MAGIYIHIPFCAKKCFYCDFFTVQSSKNRDLFFSSLLKEIYERKNYLSGERIETVYFGGGTPSILSYKEIQGIVDQIDKNFNISENAEITFEANPDDLKENYLKALKRTKINRLSIGIQSFFNDDLVLMNRRHDENESRTVVLKAQNAGFDNISIDLIYGLPKMNLKKWERNLEYFCSLNIPHLSAYHLTYEAKTVLGKRLKTGKIKEISDEDSREQFRILMDILESKNFIHYETSNFAKEGFYSKHNCSYWKNKKYLGLGPSAHSYNLQSRQYNYGNLTKYIEGIKKGFGYFEKENLNITDKFNDYIITGLRTIWGIDLQLIKSKYGIKYIDFIERESKYLLQKNYLIREKENLFIGKEAKFIEDSIIEKLFYLD